MTKTKPETENAVVPVNGMPAALLRKPARTLALVLVISGVMVFFGALDASSHPGAGLNAPASQFKDPGAKPHGGGLPEALRKRLVLTEIADIGPLRPMEQVASSQMTARPERLRGKAAAHLSF